MLITNCHAGTGRLRRGRNWLRVQGRTRAGRVAFVSCLLGALLLAGATPGGAQRDGGPRVPGASTTTTAASPSTIIVAFRRAASASARAAFVDGLGHETADTLDLPRAGVRAELIELETGESAAAAIARYERNPLVEYAEPNGRWQASATPNDPRYPELWGLHNTGQAVRGTMGVPNADIAAQEAWDVTTGSSSVVVAVVDTGVQYGHPDLAPNIWANAGETGGGKETNGVDDDGNGYVDDHRGWDWVTGQELVPGSGDNDPLDENGHGTHVAGTIGARGNDGFGVTGVSWNVKLMPLRVLDPDGAGEWWAIAKAFAYASANGAHIVNASLGGETGSLAVADAIRDANRTLFVVAAGNFASDNDSTPEYPCAYPYTHIVCVAASTPTDELASFSNWGRDTVDLAAPGIGVLSTYLRLVVLDELTADASRWTFGGANSAWGWATGGGAGGYLADSPAGSYGPNVSSRATFVDTIDLSGSSGCSLTYYLRLDVEFQFDFVAPEISVNGGTTWQPIHDGWTGSTDGEWAFIAEDIGAWDGEGDVRIRFHFFSDFDDLDGPYDGVELDDVGVHCASSSAHPYSHVAIDGTSMAAPHVAGAAALLKAKSPLATAIELGIALRVTTDGKPAFANTTASGGRLDVRQALDFVTMLPPGAPTDVGAVRGSGEATVSWTPPLPSPGLKRPPTHYIVTPHVGEASQEPIVVGGTNIPPTSVRVTGLTNGTSYRFAVRARNVIGDGLTTFSGVVVPATHPGAPTGVAASAGDARATVRWTPPASTGGLPVSTYVVTAYAGQAVARTLRVENVTQSVVTSLRNGTRYTFKVSAWNVVGGGPDSAASNAVAPAATTAAAAKLTPARPKAGRALTATVRVAMGGAPVRPTKVTCAGALGKAKLNGKPGASRGVARCVYRPPSAAKGKRLTGSVSFTAGGQRFTKRFAGRLR